MGLKIKDRDARLGKVGTRVRVEFEGIITTPASEDNDWRMTVKSEDGFTQIVNLDYPGVGVTTIKEDGTRDDQS
jgi:hypothetical protein